MRASAIDDLDAFRICRRACLAVVRHTRDAGAPRLDTSQITRLLDGAELCETIVRFRRRGSTLHPRLCDMCVEVCQRCAEICERHPDDAVMRACAEACRRCAGLCRTLASDSSPGTPGPVGWAGPPSAPPGADDQTDGLRRARA